MPRTTTEHEQVQRGKILRAANTCFGRHGYHETTIQDICDEAELSKGGLYTYFKSKEEILSALIHGGYTSALQRAQEAASEGRSAIEKLQRIAEAVVGRGPQPPQLLLEIWAEASKNPTLAALHAGAYERWRLFLAGLLREGITEGTFKADIDPEVVVTVVLAVFGGITVQEGLTGQPVDRQRVLGVLVRGLSEGIVSKDAAGGREEQSCDE